MNAPSLLLAIYNDDAEWLQARRIDHRRFLLSSIPLHGARYNYLDIISAISQDGYLVIQDVLKPSAWLSVRFKAAVSDPRFAELIAELDEMRKKKTAAAGGVEQGPLASWDNDGTAAVAFLPEHMPDINRLLTLAEQKGVIVPQLVAVA